MRWMRSGAGGDGWGPRRAPTPCLPVLQPASLSRPCRASSARAGRLEAAVAAYRGRAAAAGALRRWVRALEERHAGQLRRANALQLQLGRAQAGRAQLEAARRQVGGASGGRGYGRGGDSDWAGRHEGAGPMMEWSFGAGFKVEPLSGRG